MTSSLLTEIGGEGNATPARPVSQLAICCPPYGSISPARQTKTSGRDERENLFQGLIQKTDVYVMQLPFSAGKRSKTLPIFLA